MATWPSTLPSCFLIGGFYYNAQPVTIRTPMDAGLSKIRSRVTEAPWDLNGRMLLTKSQLVILNEFFAQTLANGSLSFTMSDPIHTYNTYDWQFISPPVYTPVGIDYYASIVLVRVPATLTALSPVIDSHPANQSVAVGETATFTAAVSYYETLLWDVGGVDITGATSLSYTTPVVSLSDNGKQYRITGTNDNASTSSNYATLTVTIGSPDWYAATYDTTDYEMSLQETGTGTPTSAHTSSIYVEDNTGAMKSVVNGRPLWRGANITTNQCPESDDLQTGWSVVSGTINSSNQVSFDAANARIVYSNVTPWPPYSIIECCFDAKDAGTGAEIEFKLTGGGEQSDPTITLDTTLRRYQLIQQRDVQADDIQIREESLSAHVVTFERISVVDRTADVMAHDWSSETELVADGDMSSATNWDLDSPWSIASGVATCNGATGNITQVFSPTLSGVDYKNLVARVEFTVSGTFSVDGLAVRPLNTSLNYRNVTSAGTYVWYAVPRAVDTDLGIRFRNNGVNDFVGDIDDVSVKFIKLAPSRFVATNGSEDTSAYNRLNANTVTDDTSIVTEAEGAQLSTQPWLHHQEEATNAQIKSNDLTDVEWTASNVTVVKDAYGVTGYDNDACTLTATAANGTVTANAVTAASGKQTTAWYIKRKTGSGDIALSVDGGSTWQNRSVTSSYQRLLREQSAVTNPQIAIRIATSGDEVIVGNAELHLDSDQEEIEDIAIIYTDAASVTTNETVYTWDGANVSNTEGYYQFTMDYAGGNTDVLSIGGTAFLYITSDTMYLSDGTTTTSMAITEGERDIVVSYGSSKMDFSIDGTGAGEVAYDGGFGTGSITSQETLKELIWIDTGYVEL